MRISDWSSDVCSSDLLAVVFFHGAAQFEGGAGRFEQEGGERGGAGYLAGEGVQGRDAGADLLQLGLCLVPLRHQFGIARSGANLQARVHRRLEGMVVAGELARRDAQALQLVVLGSEEHTSELQSLMRTPYAVFCLKKNTKQ